MNSYFIPNTGVWALIFNFILRSTFWFLLFVKNLWMLFLWKYIHVFLIQTCQIIYTFISISTSIYHMNMCLKRFKYILKCTLKVGLHRSHVYCVFTWYHIKLYMKLHVSLRSGSWLSTFYQQGKIDRIGCIYVVFTPTSTLPKINYFSINKCVVCHLL